MILKRNRCGTCRWWGEKKRALDDVGEKFRQCTAIPGPQNMTYNDGQDLPVVDPPMPGEGKAEAVDGSDYFGALRTAEDFACILWEGKT